MQCFAVICYKLKCVCCWCNHCCTVCQAELARKLEACQRSKGHYKEQWARALRELARYRQQQQKTEKARLQDQQRELDHMRLRYLAAEERAVTHTDGVVAAEGVGGSGGVSEVERLKAEVEM